MTSTLSNIVIRNLTVTLIGAVLILATVARATNFTWNVTAPPGTNAWSTATNWDIGASYPKTSSDLAVIDNRLPAGWDTGLYTINIDAADISGADLNLTDWDTYSAPTKPTNVLIHVQVQQDATFDRIDWYNDGAGLGRSRLAISGGKTLRVNTINMTGRFPDYWGNGGTLRFDPIAGAATYNYFGGHEQLGGNVIYDHQDVTTMTYNQNGGGAYHEGRDCTWRVGNAGANQTWNITNGQLRLIDRNVGAPWNFIKVGGNDVDMGYRAGSSDGVFIDRNGTGDFNVTPKNTYYLFTDASGNPMGGTVKIARYNWQEAGTASTTNISYDKLGANLTITTNGFTMTGTSNASANDVTLFYVTSGRTLKAESAALGDIVVNDSSTASTGRMGIYFAGGALDARRNLSLLGTNTFLNDGGVASAINVGGNVIVQSRNPSGFGSISGTLPAGMNATCDDFALSKTTVTLDGGASKSVTWDTGAPSTSKASLDATDFSQANFALGTLQITNNTAVTLAAGNQLYLTSDLIIEDGSTLTLGSGAMVYVLDTDLSNLARIQGYLGTRLLGAVGVSGVGGVGIIMIPEPMSALTLGLCALALLRRRARG